MAQSFVHKTVPLVQTLGRTSLGVRLKLKVDPDTRLLELETWQVVGLADLEIRMFGLPVGLRFEVAVNTIDPEIIRCTEHSGEVYKRLIVQMSVVQITSFGFSIRKPLADVDAWFCSSPFSPVEPGFP